MLEDLECIDVFTVYSQRVQLRFTKLGLHDSRVYDENDSSAPLMCSLYGSYSSELPKYITSTQPNIFVVLVSDGSGTSIGFNATFSTGV